jgi:hypothetical protein
MRSTGETPRCQQSGVALVGHAGSPARDAGHHPHVGACLVRRLVAPELTVAE